MAPTRLTLLDLIAVVMDRPTRPLDFAIILHFARTLDHVALEAGAISARFQFPSTAAILHGAAWRRPSSVAAGIEFRTVPRPNARDVMADFLDAAWDLRRTPPVRQLAISYSDGTGSVLLTRFHHAACDAIGAMLWLQHQLEVVAGVRQSVTAAGAYAPPALRRHPAPARRSAFAYTRPADRLHSGARDASHRRRWHTIPIEAATLQQLARRAGDFTYNDVLAATALETFRLWNASRGGQREPAVGLWIPVNIREQPFAGFGNGSTRVRVYNRYPAGASPSEKSRHVRRQMEWSRTHGEWSVPKLGAVARLPMGVLRPLLRAYFERPWVDMGTGPFSHVERSPLDEPVFADVASIQIVGPLDRRHSMGLYAITRAATTYLTFVHDPGQLDDESASALAALYVEQLERAIADTRS